MNTFVPINPGAAGNNAEQRGVAQAKLGESMVSAGVRFDAFGDALQQQDDALLSNEVMGDLQKSQDEHDAALKELENQRLPVDEMAAKAAQLAGSYEGRSKALRERLGKLSRPEQRVALSNTIDHSVNSFKASQGATVREYRTRVGQDMIAETIQKTPDSPLMPYSLLDLFNRAVAVSHPQQRGATAAKFSQHISGRMSDHIMRIRVGATGFSADPKGPGVIPPETAIKQLEELKKVASDQRFDDKVRLQIQDTINDLKANGAKYAVKQVAEEKEYNENAVKSWMANPALNLTLANPESPDSKAINEAISVSRSFGKASFEQEVVAFDSRLRAAGFSGADITRYRKIAEDARAAVVKVHSNTLKKGAAEYNRLVAATLANLSEEDRNALIKRTGLDPSKPNKAMAREIAYSNDISFSEFEQGYIDMDKVNAINGGTPLPPDSPLVTSAEFNKATDIGRSVATTHLLGSVFGIPLTPGAAKNTALATRIRARLLTQEGLSKTPVMFMATNYRGPSGNDGITALADSLAAHLSDSLSDNEDSTLDAMAKKAVNMLPSDGFRGPRNESAWLTQTLLNVDGGYEEGDGNFLESYHVPGTLMARYNGAVKRSLPEGVEVKPKAQLKWLLNTTIDNEPIMVLHMKEESSDGSNMLSWAPIPSSNETGASPVSITVNEYKMARLAAGFNASWRSRNHDDWVMGLRGQAPALADKPSHRPLDSSPSVSSNSAVTAFQRMLTGGNTRISDVLGMNRNQHLVREFDPATGGYSKTKYTQYHGDALVNAIGALSLEHRRATANIILNQIGVGADKKHLREYFAQNGWNSEVDNDAVEMLWAARQQHSVPTNSPHDPLAPMYGEKRKAEEEAARQQRLQDIALLGSVRRGM